MALTARLRRRRDTAGEGTAIDLLSSSFLGYSGDLRGWDTATQRPLDPISPEAARASHMGGRAYSVVRREAGQVIVVGVASSHEVKVTRFDPSGTVTAETREFREVDGQLWLRGIKRVNGGNSVPPEHLITDWFTWVRPDTTATWTRFDRTSPQGRAHALDCAWTAEDHWYTRPEFGDYTGLIGQSDLLRQLWPDVEPLSFIGR